VIEAKDEVINKLGQALRQQQVTGDGAIETTQSSKRSKFDDTYCCDLEEVAETSRPQSQSQNSEQPDEVQRSLLQPKISTDDDPYDWWYKHRELFPNLSVIARYYLATPASSVADERIFSGTGKLLEPKRNRLGSKNASMLAFLYFNLSSLNYDYNPPTPHPNDPGDALLNFRVTTRPSNP
jgi:hypothetical protein